MEKPDPSPPVEIGSDARVRERVQDVELLLNAVEPDQEYQPSLLTDEATLFDAVIHDETRSGGG